MDEIGEHRVELLRFAPVNFVRSQMPRPPFEATAIPLEQKRVLSATSFAPTDAMPHGCVGGRHRLAVEANHLSQATREAGLRVGKGHALGANATTPTPHAPLPIHERHVMRGPRQVVPCPIPARSHPARASAAPATGVAPHSSALDVNLQATALRRVHRHDPKSRQPQNPRTIAPRSHRSSLVVAHQEKMTPDGPVHVGSH